MSDTEFALMSPFVAFIYFQYNAYNMASIYLYALGHFFFLWWIYLIQWSFQLLGYMTKQGSYAREDAASRNNNKKPK